MIPGNPGCPRFQCPCFRSGDTKAVDQLSEVVRCPNPDCSCAMTVDGGRQRWQCCEWPAWFIKCRQPYHYKVECEAVEAEKLVILSGIQ